MIMMAQIKGRLVELINLALIEVDDGKKVEYLNQIKELAFNNGLIDDFFQDIVAFHNDRSPKVKKSVLSLIEAAFKHDCRLCPRAMLILRRLLDDTNTEVVKRSIQAATHFYRALVNWIAMNSGQSPSSPANQPSQQQQPQQQQPSSPPTQQQQQQPLQIAPSQSQNQQPFNSNSNQGPNATDREKFVKDIEDTWPVWLQCKSIICNLLETTNNDGVQTHCIKFIETIVLMQTLRDKHTDSGHELNLIEPMITPIELIAQTDASFAGLPENRILFDENHKLELVEAAKRSFAQLIEFHGTSHISSVNLMATMQSLVVIAKQRYRLFMGPVIQAMESLNNRLPPTLTESQVQSVKKFLKLQLTVMLKHPYSLERFQNQITQLLQAVGSKQPEIHKVINDYKHKFGNDSQVINNNANPEVQKRIKLETSIKTGHQGPQGNLGTQSVAVGRSKHLDLNRLTQELDEREKRQIVVDSVRRILGEEKISQISPAQMEIKKKVLSTLANEFHNTECPAIIQDYIFNDLKNRHEICYSIIRKNYDVAASKAAKRQINLFDNQELLKNYFDCFNSYLNRAMELGDTKDRDIILPKLYALREEYYTISNQDQEQDHDGK